MKINQSNFKPVTNVQKELHKWCVINHSTGEVLEVNEPSSFWDAFQLFKKHINGNLKGWMMYESIEIAKKG